MPTAAKVQEVERLTELLSSAQSVVLTDFTGLNVDSISTLRQKCREAGVQYRVVKNTLARRAVSAAGLEDLTPLLEGPNAWAVHESDQLAAARVIEEFAKDNTNLRIRAGFMEGRVLSVDEVTALAKLPGRETLLAQTVGALQAPMAGFAGALNAVLRGFASVVDAYAKKRAGSEGGS